MKNKPDWFSALSPSGKAPVLVADGHVVFESSIIMELIDETHPPALLPIEPFERARHRQWVETANELLSHMPKMWSAASREDHDAARRSFGAILVRIEGEPVAPQGAGDGLSFVDVAFAPIFYR